MDYFGNRQNGVKLDSVEPSRRQEMRYDDKIYAKRTFSRFFLGYTVFYACARLFLYGVIYALQLLLPYLPREIALKIVEVVNSTPFGVFFPYAVLYVVSLPILYIFVKDVKTRKFEKRRLGLGMFLILFFSGCMLMRIGSVMGSGLTKLINSFLGLESTDLFSDIPLWAATVVLLVIAPIFEELIFRKLLMDRIGVWGTWLSVIVSGLAFGAFHGTIEQLFYTTSVGMIFAFAYAKTGRLRYSILLHFTFNLFGSVIPMLVSEYMLSSTDFYYLLGFLLVLVISIGFAIVGAVLFIIGLCRGWFSLESRDETKKITSCRARIMFFNVGSILYTLLTVYLILTSFMPISDWLLLILGK